MQLKSNISGTILPKESGFELNEQEKYWVCKLKDDPKIQSQLTEQVLIFPIERIVVALIFRKKQDTIQKNTENYFKLYKQINFANILNTKINNEDEITAAWPMYCYGADKFGHPVIYDELCSDKLTVNKLRKACDGNLALIKQYRHKFNRRLCDIKLQQTKKLSKCIFKHVAIIDCAKFSVSQHFSSDIRNMLQEIIDEETILFPETAYKVYLINAPYSFRIAWSFINKFLDNHTCEKIMILGSKYLKELLKEINIDQIPVKYGGKGTEEIVLGY